MAALLLNMFFEEKEEVRATQDIQRETATYVHEVNRPKGLGQRFLSHVHVQSVLNEGHILVNREAISSLRRKKKKESW